MTSPSKRIKVPAQACASCPWRKDRSATDIANFSLEMAENLAATCPDARGMGPDYGATWFACHQSKEGAEFPCAGWLASVGSAHPGVRHAIMSGRLDAASLTAPQDGPELHESYGEMIAKLRQSSASRRDPASNESEGSERISEVCTRMRDIFERILAVTGVESTAGSCLHASVLLSQSLDRYAGCETVVRGGNGLLDGGAQSASGEWRGHYWVEGITKGGEPFLADITADQFGWPPVVILPLASARARYRPGNDDAVGLAVDELVASLEAQVR
ncbi:DUF6283 family protein [Pseudomonas aeruginosa]